MAEKKEDKKEKVHGQKQTQKPQGHFSKIRTALNKQNADIKAKQIPKTERKFVLERDPYDVLKFVLMTEKSVRQIELQNKLVFIVDRKSKKPEIKNAAQAAFSQKVSGVKTVIDQAGRKKAFVRFKEAGAAGEIAVRLGII